jgi:hypothetical protein
MMYAGHGLAKKRDWLLEAALPLAQKVTDRDQGSQSSAVGAPFGARGPALYSGLTWPSISRTETSSP